MTVTVTSTSNSPHEFNLRRLQDTIVAQTAFIATLGNGTAIQNDANQKLVSQQREFVDALMNSGKLSPATILANCTYSS